MYVIIGHLQPYAWGADGGLNEWLPGEPGPGPQAELWFGAHPNGPSPLLGQPATLADVAGEVPLLVKLMAAARPLSIQLHPDRERAVELFAAGSPLVSDDRAKIEMLIALEPFSIFAGWRDADQAAALLEATDPVLVPAAAAARAGDTPAAIRALLATDRATVGALIPRLLAAAQQARLGSEELHALALAAHSYPDDPGVLVTALLDQRLLAPGEAVYMPAGGVHAYVQGFGIEVMTASDNVLRLGMTGKPIAVDEALASLSRQGQPHLLGADVQLDHGHPVVSSYRPYGAPFSVELVRASDLVAFGGVYRLVLCVRGEVDVTCDGLATTLQPGQACAILAGEGDAQIRAVGTAAVVEARGAA